MGGGKTKSHSKLELKVAAPDKAEKDHDHIISYIASRYYCYGYDKVVKQEKYEFTKSDAPLRIDANQGEIDLYVINYRKNRIILFEIKTGNKDHEYTAKRQLKRGEIYLRTLYPDYKYHAVHVWAKKKGSGVEFKSINRMKNLAKTRLVPEQESPVPKTTLKKRKRKKGKERKEIQTQRQKFKAFKEVGKLKK